MEGQKNLRKFLYLCHQSLIIKAQTMKEFNTTGICYPEDHYMVNIDSRVDEIEKAVAKGEYITINRGRQYGKTTTLYHLTNKLNDNYVVFSISFESMGEAEFKDIESLSFAFADALSNPLSTTKRHRLTIW